MAEQHKPARVRREWHMLYNVSYVAPCDLAGGAKAARVYEQCRRPAGQGRNIRRVI